MMNEAPQPTTPSKTMADVNEELKRALWFIESQGYRRCDIAACNCSSWHGSNLRDRFDEIQDALQEADISTNGKTLLTAIKELIARASHPPKAGAEADAFIKRLDQWLDRWEYGDYEWDMAKNTFIDMRALLLRITSTADKPATVKPKCTCNNARRTLQKNCPVHHVEVKPSIDTLIAESSNTQEMADKVTALYGEDERRFAEWAMGLVAEMEELKTKPSNGLPAEMGVFPYAIDKCIATVKRMAGMGAIC